MRGLMRSPMLTYWGTVSAGRGMVDLRLFGSVVRLALQSGLPWGSMTLSVERCSLRSGLGRYFAFERDDVSLVQLRVIRLGLSTRTVIAFFGSDGERMTPQFVPFRPERARMGLLSMGWPTELVTWPKLRL